MTEMNENKNLDQMDRNQSSLLTKMTLGDNEDPDDMQIGIQGEQMKVGRESFKSQIQELKAEHMAETA
jgi:hypothetical protein